MTVLALAIFAATVLAVVFKPRGVNEAVPAVLGASAALVTGVIGFGDVMAVSGIVWGAAATVLATMMMTTVLDDVGCFKWAALNIVTRARGSGVRLLFYVMGLALLMTLFLNNDGSILIVTPIIVETMFRLGLRGNAALAYVVAAGLIATISSAPIGVSNFANLTAMQVVGFNLNQHAQFMLLPSIFGIATCALAIFVYFRGAIPRRYDVDGLNVRVLVVQSPAVPNPARQGKMRAPSLPADDRRGAEPARDIEIDLWMIRFGVAVVVLVRIGFFVGTHWGVPIPLVAVLGAAVMLLVHAARRGRYAAWSVARRAPWHIILYAFGMYLIVYGLRAAGATHWLADALDALGGDSPGRVIVWSGVFMSFMSATMLNLPALMLGALTLAELTTWSPTLLKLAYTAFVLGSDIGSLLTPIGTLAVLLWFHVVRSHGMGLTWGDYFRVATVVIPLSMGAALLGLYLWYLFLRHALHVV